MRSSENALISKDLNGVVTAWNGGAERLYGYTEEAAVGRQIAELIIPAANADEMKLVTKSVLEGEAVSLETERRRQSGQLGRSPSAPSRSGTSRARSWVCARAPTTSRSAAGER